MTTWTLLVILIGWKELAVTSVPGFTSRAACDAAVVQVRKDVGESKFGVFGVHKLVCVEVK